VGDALGLLAILALVLANGFFVATEFATVAVRRSRLEQLAQEGHAAALEARDVVAHLDGYIAATQLGITMASLALGWVGEPALAHLVEPALEPIVGHFAPAAAHGAAVAVAFTAITGLHIVVGELAPKGLALQHPEATVLCVARPIKWFYALFRWPVTALNAVGNATLRLFGLSPASGHEMVHSVEELRLLVTGMQQAGVVEAAEARIASRAFVFADLTAGALMTPRTEVEAVPVTAGLAELLALAETTRHSRLPVYDGGVDDVVGVLHVRDLFRHRDTPPGAFDLRTLVRPILSVPITEHAHELLEEMRAERRHIALVVDEYGGTAGVVTVEDLVQALVGPVAEEAAAADEPPTDGRPEPDGSVLFDGLTRLEEFEEAAGIRLDQAAHRTVETLGGLTAAVLGRFPEVGEELTVAGRRLRIEARDGLRVAAVRLLPTQRSPG